MKTSALRKELHLAIDTITDTSLLEAVYIILNKSMHDLQLTSAQEKELAARIERHEKGETKSTPWKKSIKNIREKLKK